MPGQVKAVGRKAGFPGAGGISRESHDIEGPELFTLPTLCFEVVPFDSANSKVRAGAVSALGIYPAKNRVSADVFSCITLITFL